MCASLDESSRKTGFAPFSDLETRLLILGSLPGNASLSAGQYYANPRNQFWTLIAAVIEQNELGGLPYPDRLAILARHGIGLWDVFASATRRGSLDTAIRQAATSPLCDLIRRLPALRAIAFNGALAAKTGRKLIVPTMLALVDLPSSSPAHAALRVADKLKQWSALKQFLN